MSYLKKIEDIDYITHDNKFSYTATVPVCGLLYDADKDIEKLKSLLQEVLDNRWKDYEVIEACVGSAWFNEVVDILSDVKKEMG